MKHTCVAYVLKILNKIKNDIKFVFFINVYITKISSEKYEQKMVPKIKLQ